VAKCHGPRADGGPVGLPALELKTLKIYFSVKYNYLKIFIYYEGCPERNAPCFFPTINIYT
jgi:hypothetical protein